MDPHSSSDFDSYSSSCSSASPGGDTPGCSQQHPPDRLSSPVDSSITQEGAANSFVPTVTAVSTSPDLRWMVQPTVNTSVSPPSTRAKSRSRGAAHASSSTRTAGGASRAKTSSRKGQRSQSSKKEEEREEEEERRRIRRERNKIAAAKCRNRRRELIDTLQAETDLLEDEKSALHMEITELLKEKKRLEKVLSSHKPSCKIPSKSDEEEDLEEEEVEEEESEDDVDTILQDPPSSPQLLSIIENGKTPEKNTAIGEAVGQDGNDASCVPAAAILGNSNILLCSSAEEEEALQDLAGDDLDDLVPSLEMAVTSEAAASVPDVDLSGAFCLPDWETLYKSVTSDLDSLNTPVMSSSPNCSSFRTVFSFNCAEMDSLDEDCDVHKGSLGASELMKDSLNSPTLLTL